MEVEYQAIIYEAGDHHVAAITLNRPEKLNSFNRVMLEEFRHVWAAVRQDTEVHAVVIQAAGRAFSAGLEVSDPRARAAAEPRRPNRRRPSAERWNG